MSLACYCVMILAISFLVIKNYLERTTSGHYSKSNENIENGHLGS